MTERGKIEGGEPGDTMLVAEYVLGVLDPETHARVGRMIAADPRLVAERDFWQARLSGLDDEFIETAAPENVLPRIEARLFGTTSLRSRWWDSLPLWRGLAAGALAVAILAIGFGVMRPAGDVATIADQLVAALEAEGSDVRFLALYDGQGQVRLTALSGAAGPDKDFELWAIQGGAPISMGVIPGQIRHAVTLAPEVMAGWGEGSVLAITLEQAGGSPDGNPHGPVVAQGTATSI